MHNRRAGLHRESLLVADHARQIVNGRASSRRGVTVAGIAAAALVIGLASPCLAQEPGFSPLDQYAPPGEVGHWSAQIGKGLAHVLQPIRVVLPTTGSVAVYNGGPAPALEMASPAQFHMGVGFLYRLKLANMPEFPGVELYPTIEILDRLHPPRGREDEFPVQIIFKADDLQAAIDGRMVSKVVYLEQPQIAVTGELTAALLNRYLPPDRNLLVEADKLGRPMVLIRLGSRTPTGSVADATFYGPPVPLAPAKLQPAATAGAPSGRALVQDGRAIFSRAEPRAEIEHDNAQRLASRRGLMAPTPPRPFALIEPIAPPWELFPDEYLFDGGDRGLAVHDHVGLDTEDAVAEYVDRSGARHILPTNRVAIYSPRFGDVGTATGVEAGVTITGPANAVDRLRGQSVRNMVASTNQAQRMPSQTVRTRSRASGFNSEENEVGVKQRTAIGQDLALSGSVENVQDTIAPTLRKTQLAKIAKLRQAAIAWTRRDYPVVTGSLAGAQQIKAKFVVNEMVGIEEHRRRGRLEIVKLADKQTAQRGEIVNFTIEYENIGDTEVGQVQIIDNLTPRLEYVDESGKSNRPAMLNVTDNGEGSVILTWTLRDPLPGRSKGSVTFQARVR